MEPELNAHLRLILEGEIDRLAKEFAGTFDRETVDRYVHDCLAQLGNARVTEYLPAFAGRFAGERLKALGQTRGQIAKERPQVVFVGAHGAGRSQMAAAFARQLGEGRVSARIAGASHAGDVQSEVVEVMREVGIDVAREFPRPLTEEVFRAADVVVTMGCPDGTCPIDLAKSYRDWQIDDPAGKPVAKIREIRDAVRAHVTALLRELGVPGAPPV